MASISHRTQKASVSQTPGGLSEIANCRNNLSSHTATKLWQLPRAIHRIVILNSDLIGQMNRSCSSVYPYTIPCCSLFLRKITSNQENTLCGKQQPRWPPFQEFRSSSLSNNNRKTWRRFGCIIKLTHFSILFFNTRLFSVVFRILEAPLYWRRYHSILPMNVH